jgi:glycosyltransferase involved in cell wall biosynthesis
MGDLKVGMVCIYWPPAHGGAERYAYEMAQALRNRGVDLEVFTGTTELPDKNNGDVEVIRPEQNYYISI